ncbi:MAG TPA: hypothetical protein ENF58_01290 [Candidatus Altiarchaeales archaeon]|nr:hypothetical protein [Candidatus Altiarchaeales archaeon]
MKSRSIPSYYPRSKNGTTKQKGKIEKFWSVLEKDKGFNKLPKKEYTKRVFLIAMNMTLDIFFSLKKKEDLPANSIKFDYLRWI